MPLDTHVHAHRNPPPSGTKRFETHHMRRIPVQVTESAKALIGRSVRQGRLLPQALSEFFGTLPEVECVWVDLIEDRIVIDIKASDASKGYQFFLASSDFLQVPRNPRDGFDAARTVDELLRLYRRDVLREGSV
jgi:hypothetical protein